MRQLAFLSVGFALTLLGVRLIVGADTFEPYLLRDGLLVGGLGALVFALNTPFWRAQPPTRRLRWLPRAGGILVWTGALSMLVAGIGVGLQLADFFAMGAWFTWVLGLILLLVGAAWPGGETEYTPPAYRWETDDAGAYVRVPIEENQTGDAQLSRRTLLVWLTVILIAAGLLRFWNLGDLPPGCVGNECVNGLRLVEGQALTSSAPEQLNLLEHGARALFTVTASGVLSLRILAALAGLLTVLTFFGVAYRLVGSTSALLATLLLALNPWHIWASRSSDPWTITGLLATLALWLLLQASAHRNQRWWAPAGLALGLLFVEAPLLRSAILLWAGGALALELVRAWRAGRSTGAMVAPLLGATAWLGAAMPALAGAARGATFLAGLQSAEGWQANFAVMAGSLLRPDTAPGAPFTDNGLLAGFVAAFVLVGIGVLLRHLRQPAAVITLLGGGLVFGFGARLDLATLPPASLLLILLPFALAAAAVALDQLVKSLMRTWAMVVRPMRLAALVAVMLVLLLGENTVAFMADLDAVRSGAQSQIETEMAQSIARRMLDPAGADTTFIVPAAVLAHPSLRLLAGPALAEGRILPLDIARTIPYVGVPPGDLVYLLPTSEAQTLDLLRRTYPTGAAFTELDDAGERSLFNRFEVPQAVVADSHRLQMLVYAGSDGDGADAAAQVTTVASLDLPWATDPPLAGPYSVEWYGSLLVPETGVYGFSVETVADAPFVLQVDDILVLDTELGVARQELPLVQGLYQLNLTYRSGIQPGDLRVELKRPDETIDVLGGEVVHLPVLPNQGLMAEYYPNARSEGSPVLQRKEPIIGLDPGLDIPYSARWRGQLGAARAGEYLISAIGAGTYQVLIDDQLVVNGLPETDQPTDAFYTEGTVFLPSGWHPIEVRYIPSMDPFQFRLLWQPPGAEPGELSGQYLVPTTATVGPADRPLPPAPPLVDDRLGDDTFALSRASDIWQPRIRMAPTALPPLAMETLWKVGNGCGPGADQLNAPHGLTFAAGGDRLYVADTGNRRIVVYDLDGGRREVIASELFEEPVDVALGVDGKLLVLDAVANPIFRVDEQGNPAPVAIQTGFYRPRGFDVDPNGNIVVADTGGGRVAVLEPSGAFVGQLGGPESLLAAGQPVDTLGVADALWVVSAEDGRVWNLHVDGSLTGVQPTDTINGPQLAGLPDGSFFVSDPARRSFTYFTPAGQPVKQFAYIDQLVTPTGISAIPLGNDVFVAASDTRLLHRFTLADFGKRVDKMTRRVGFLFTCWFVLWLTAACGSVTGRGPIGLALDAPQVLAARASATPAAIIPAPAIPAETLARLSTEDQLNGIVLPPRDLRELTLRLNPDLDSLPLVVNETTPDHAIGDRINFWVLDTNTAAKHEVTAELIHKTDVAYAWVQVDQEIDHDALVQSVDRFSEISYPNEVAVFGSEWHPGIDNDPRLHILYTTGMGSRVAGYFSSSDEYPVEANPFSNEKEMFYISLDALSGPTTYQYHETVLAHEFQHMIHWNKDRAEDIWISEGLSEYAQQVAQYAPDTIFVSSFSTEPDLQLTTWKSPTAGSNAPHYASAYLFVAYLAQRFGDAFLADLVAEPANGMNGVTAALERAGIALTGEEIFADWVIANFVQNPEALDGDGLYGYRQLKLPAFSASAAHSQFPAVDQSEEVHNYGTDYIQLMGEGNGTFQFSGSTDTRLASVSPLSGEHMWWSNRGDYANSRLTRRFDLTEVEVGTPVTMTASLWWNIEEDYDYGYVMASRDGEKWAILPGQRTHIDEVNGNGLGPGYTGQSTDATSGVPGWVDETYDLGAYAGGPLWIQFSYVTDDAVNASGWYVDDVAIPAIGYATDFEQDVAGWESEGWLLTDNQLPQHWLVQLMEFDGAMLTALHRIPVVDGQATVEIEGLGNNRYAVVAVSGLTPGTTEQATYQYSILPRAVE